MVVSVLLRYKTDFSTSVGCYINIISPINQQPYQPAAQDRFPTEAKQGWAGQYLDGRPPGKTRLLLEKVLVRPAEGAHPVVCVGPNTPV